MTINIILVVVLVLALAFVSALNSGRKRRDFMQRMDREIGPVQKHPRFELIEVPKFCLCGRRMTEPIGLVTETGIRGSRDIPVCSVCRALGVPDSIIAAAAETVVSSKKITPAEKQSVPLLRSDLASQA